MLKSGLLWEVQKPFSFMPFCCLKDPFPFFIEAFGGGGFAYIFKVEDN